MHLNSCVTVLYSVHADPQTFMEHDHECIELERTSIAATEALPLGKAQLKVDFAYQGGPKELGKGAVVTITANGKKGG